MTEGLVGDLRYRVELDLTASGVAALSRTEIRFRCAQPGASAHADLALASVKRIELNGTTLSPQLWHDRRLDLPSLDDENVLFVEGTVAFASGRDGLCTFVDDGGDRFVYLHLPARAPETAAEVMCCFVDAGRGAFDLTVIAPAGWTVHSHGRPTEQPAQGNAGKWRFVAPVPVEARPTIAAGPWASRSDVHARPSLKRALEASPISQLRDAVVQHHERLLKVPDPFGQMPCVLVPGYGSQGSNGGGLMMCHERVLHGSLEQEWQAYAMWVLAHEAAHSWFGGLFEVRGPHDHWLYEGTATYLCHRAMSDVAPELSPWARFHVLEEAEAHDVDVGPDAHAVANMPASSTAPVARGLAPLVYSKPAAVLRHLERVVGRDAVDRALRVLLRDHSGGVADTDDFVHAIEHTSGDACHAEWVEDWLRTPGVNTLTWHQNDATVHQSPSNDGRLRTHHITIISFDLLGGALVPRPTIDTIIRGATTRIPTLATSQEPALVVLNAPATSYVRVRLDDRSRSTLVDHLGSLPPDIRAVCWVATWEMAKDGLVPWDEWRFWTATYANLEPDPQVRNVLSAT